MQYVAVVLLRWDID